MFFTFFFLSFSSPSIHSFTEITIENQQFVCKIITAFHSSFFSYKRYIGKEQTIKVTEKKKQLHKI